MAREIDRRDEHIEITEGIATIRPGIDKESWNGLSYDVGISARTVGSRDFSMNVATVPPGGIAKAHIHVGFEVGLYILKGKLKHTYGERLEKEIYNQAGDFIYIEPGVPHEVYNLSDTEEVVAVVCRTSAAQWDDIIPYEVPAE
ncbi:MAG TPA: cupin domain-containing protein [Thermomicrobiales bacterium]|nr:cupin domain-containing protein [Thermomicrobiales bacterium]